MKLRILTLAIIALFSINAFGQNSKVVSANLAYKDALVMLGTNNFEDGAKNLQKAIEFIEPTITNEKSMVKEKTWRYRGEIYTLVAQYSSKDEIKSLVSDPITKAKESYEKQMELDTKGSYKKEVAGAMESLKNLSINAGIDRFNDENYEKALMAFNIATDISSGMGILDTAIVFNAGLAAEKAGMIDEALAKYQKCIDTGYNGADMYYTMVNLYKSQDRMEDAKKAIEAGLEKYPGNPGLLGEQVNMSLSSGDSKGAQEGVRKMIEEDPTNPNLRFVLGNTLDKEGDKEGAIAAYEKAIELNPEYFDAVYNIGAMYFNDAVEANKVCNDIPPKEFKKYDACKESVLGQFRTALPYFEQAKALQGDDKGTLQSLMQIYGQLGQTEKQIEMKKLLGM